MIKMLITKIVNRFGIWRTVQISIASLSVILLASASAQFFAPLYMWQAGNDLGFARSENISLLPGDDKDKKKEAIAYRAGMFKPATGLGDKPIVDKTVERIKGQLKLQCVMEMNGQLVVYINIQGVGLRKCCIGENINDLFTVLDINKQNKSVDISIVEHKITLHL